LFGELHYKILILLLIKTMGIIGEIGLSAGGAKLADALGFGDVGTAILSGIGGFLGSLLPFKAGGKVPAGYRKVIHMGKVYLVATRRVAKKKKRVMKKRK